VRALVVSGREDGAVGQSKKRERGRSARGPAWPRAGWAEEEGVGGTRGEGKDAPVGPRGGGGGGGGGGAVGWGGGGGGSLFSLSSFFFFFLLFQKPFPNKISNAIKF